MPPIGKGTHTAKTLRNLSERLEAVQQQLQGAADILERESLDGIEYKYQGEAMKGLDKLEDFAESGLKAIKLLRKHRGDFGSTTDTNDSDDELTANKSKDLQTNRKNGTSGKPKSPK